MEEKEQTEEKLVKKNEGTKATTLSKFFRIILSFTITLIVFGITALTLYYFELGNEKPQFYFSKGVKTKISEAIKHGADLDIIKHLYNSREIKKRNIFSFFTEEEESYEEPTALGTILNDVRAEHYLSAKGDTTFLKKVKEIIEEHDQVNPFDKLEPNQKFIFENIRFKLDTSYVHIQDDLNRVADDLNNKNLLVNQYLDKSNLSYWISIVALVVTVVLSTIQIYQGRTSKAASESLTTPKPPKPENNSAVPLETKADIYA